MMQNVVREIGGVGLYGVVSILLFTFVFGGALIWAVCMKKAVAERLSALPLEEGGGIGGEVGDGKRHSSAALQDLAEGRERREDSVAAGDRRGRVRSGEEAGDGLLSEQGGGAREGASIAGLKRHSSAALQDLAEGRGRRGDLMGAGDRRGMVRSGEEAGDGLLSEQGVGVREGASITGLKRHSSAALQDLAEGRERREDSVAADRCVGLEERKFV